MLSKLIQFEIKKEYNEGKIILSKNNCDEKILGFNARKLFLSYKYINKNIIIFIYNI